MTTISDDTMWTAVIAAASATLSGILTHVFSRPKQKADVHTAIATGASTAVDAITDVLEQVRLELMETRAELHEARDALTELREENAQLRDSVALLNIRITELQRAEEIRRTSSHS